MEGNDNNALTHLLKDAILCMSNAHVMHPTGQTMLPSHALVQ